MRVLRVGRRFEMNKPRVELAGRIIDFAKSNIESSGIYGFGTHSFELFCSDRDDISKMIIEAFLPSNSIFPQFKLYIIRESDYSDSDFLISVMHGERIYREIVDQNFIFACDEPQGMFYILDKIEHVGVVILRQRSFLNEASFITPFRLIFSWFANVFSAEIIHASAINYLDKGILFNGPSGSGKSTTAFLALSRGASIVCDDVALFEDGLIHAVYRFGKINSDNIYVDSQTLNSFEIPNGKSGKSILVLEKNRFTTNIKMDIVVLPQVSYISGFRRLPSDLAFKLISENTLREIFGGLPSNMLRLKKIIDSYPVYRLALSGETEVDLDNLERIIAE